MPRPTQKKSIVWSFFELDADKKSATCKICRKSYKYHSNTSNIKEHLKRVHPIQFQDEAECSDVPSNRQQQINDIQAENLNNNTQPNNIIISAQQTNDTPAPFDPVNPKRKRQLRLCTTEKTNELNDDKIRDLDQAVLGMIYQDFQPLSLVEDTGFRNLVQKLNSKYTLPSRKSLSEKILFNTYTIEQGKLAEQLKLVTYISLTTDYWKAVNNKDFLSLTAHYIFDNKLHSKILATEEVKVTHTGSNTAEVIKNICNKYDIYNKIVTVVTDNAANMKKAVTKDLRKYHHPCIAHTINLTVTDSLVIITDLIVKCRSLVTYFKQSSTAAYKLKEKQNLLNFPELIVKQDISTRWNSTYIMFDRLLEVREPLTLALADLDRSPGNLSGNEWAIVKDCLPILKPFLEFTEELSGEKYVTMSKVVPLIRGLRLALRSCVPLTDIGLRLQATLSDAITRRLGTLESTRAVEKATFLDPRFKKTGFGHGDNANNAQQWIIDELTSMMRDNLVLNTEQPTVVPSDATPLNNNNQSSSLWSYFDEKASQQSYYETPNTTALVMVRQYIETKLLNRNNDPLMYWQDHKKMFPGLSKLAEKYLSIPATSVPSERLFSKAGCILNERRNRLNSLKLNEILFLNGNIPIAKR